jgi:TonB family protein
MPPAFVVDVALKVTLIFAIGGLVATLMYRASAASRHAVWAGVCVAALALPVAQLVVPTTDVSWWPSWARTVAQPDEAVASAPAVAAAIDMPAARQDVQGRATGAVWLRAAWLVSVAWSVGVVVGLARVWRHRRAAHRLTSRARPETDERVVARAHFIAGWVGASSFTLRQGPADWMPATWGVRQPVVMLPSTAREWSDARLDPVLVHELAHVARRDAGWHAVVQVMMAVWWMHPLAWVAARRLRTERERACDDVVLAFGARASDYASDLVSLAGECGETELTLAMARRSQLEGRVMAILNPRLQRNGRTGAATLVAAALVLAMVPMASLTSMHVVVAAAPDGEAAAQQAAGQIVRIGGDVKPPEKIKHVPPVYPEIARSARVQGIVIAEVLIDADGLVSEAKVIRPVALLDQAALEAVRQWEFTPTEINGVAVPVIMTVTISFSLDDAATPVANLTAAEEQALAQGRAMAAELAARRAQMPPPTWNPGDPPLRIGGNVKAPVKIKHVNPVYPPEAQQARVQGIVIIEAQIDQDGRVSSARVIRPVALLDDAALDAVLQWEFTPTVLDGKPVPVIMTVTVNFTLS